MLSIGFRCVLGHFRRFQVCVILRVGMRVVSEIRLCSLRPRYLARDCCIRTKYVRSASSSQHEVTENESTRSTKVCD